MNKQKKYEMIPEGDLFRIRALIDMPEYGVKIGDVGGIIEAEQNLAQFGNGWICSTAKVIQSAVVVDAYIRSGSTVSGRSHVVMGVVSGSKIMGNTKIEADIQIHESTIQNCTLFGDGEIRESKLSNCTFNSNVQFFNCTIHAELSLFSRGGGTLSLRHTEINIEEGNIIHSVDMERVQLRTKTFKVEHRLFMQDAHIQYRDKIWVVRLGVNLRTEIQGEKDNPIQLKGKNLMIDDSLIKGGMVLSGNFEIRSSKIVGIHHIDMNKAYIQDSKILDCVTIKQTLPRVQLIVDKIFEGDMTIDYDQQ